MRRHALYLLLCYRRAVSHAESREECFLHIPLRDAHVAPSEVDFVADRIELSVRIQDSFVFRYSVLS
jgi:hypothetical protein